MATAATHGAEESSPVQVTVTTLTPKDRDDLERVRSMPGTRRVVSPVDLDDEIHDDDEEEDDADVNDNNRDRDNDDDYSDASSDASSDIFADLGEEEESTIWGDLEEIGKDGHRHHPHHLRRRHHQLMMMMAQYNSLDESDRYGEVLLRSSSRRQGSRRAPHPNMSNDFSTMGGGMSVSGNQKNYDNDTFMGAERFMGDPISMCVFMQDVVARDCHNFLQC